MSSGSEVRSVGARAACLELDWLLLDCPSKTGATGSVAGQDSAFVRYCLLSGGLVVTCCAET